MLSTLRSTASLLTAILVTAWGCAHEAAKQESTAASVGAAGSYAATEASVAPSVDSRSAGLMVAGRPVESITVAELVAAVNAQGWVAPKDLPAAMAVMQRRDGGRESITAVFDKGGVRLNVMIVRPIPGEELVERSSVASAAATHDAYHSMGKPVVKVGESALVVLDGAIGVPGASKAQLQQLFEALVGPSPR
jgi:hypothetical protein